MQKVIGLDFDNTLVSYDRLFYTTALQRGLIPDAVSIDKTAIRDHVRTLENGEIEWQKLQASVYGVLMPQALLIEGVLPFLEACNEDDAKVFIVSHKTQYAAQDTERIDLRQAARDWIEVHGLKVDDVFFADTRLEKVQKINSLNCTHFVDDLVEVFEIPEFSGDVDKILFTKNTSTRDDMKCFNNWKDIYEYVFSR